jgi:archaellum component FlaF (FlaF/FlaG flagellin family)
VFRIFLVVIGNHLHIISHAASGYHKVQEENRKLYNQIQDLRGTTVGVLPNEVFMISDSSFMVQPYMLILYFVICHQGI